MNIKACAALLLPSALALAAPAALAQEIRSAVVDPAVSSVADPYYRKKEEGWFWYKDPPAEPEKKPAKAMPAPAPIPVAKPKEVMEHEALQRKAEELLKIAFIRPTEENVRAYLAVQTQIVNQSSKFSDVWQRVVWANPDFDFTLQDRPVTAAGIAAWDREQEKSRSVTIQKLAQTHVLWFFYRSDCPYCHAFAPVLKRFESQFGLRIFPISLDGGALPDFPQFKTDNGVASRLGVSHVPALFLTVPGAGQILPIGFGVLSDAELVNRVYTVATQPTPGEASTRPVQNAFKSIRSAP